MRTRRSEYIKVLDIIKIRWIYTAIRRMVNVSCVFRNIRFRVLELDKKCLCLILSFLSLSLTVQMLLRHSYAHPHERPFNHEIIASTQPTFLSFICTYINVPTDHKRQPLNPKGYPTRIPPRSCSLSLSKSALESAPPNCLKSWNLTVILYSYCSIHNLHESAGASRAIVKLCAMIVTCIAEPKRPKYSSRCCHGSLFGPRLNMVEGESHEWWIR